MAEIDTGREKIDPHKNSWERKLLIIKKKAWMKSVEKFNLLDLFTEYYIPNSSGI